MLHNFQNPLKHAAAGFSEPQAQDYQPRFTAWLCLEISEASISSSHLRLLYNSGRVALGKRLISACTTQETRGPAHSVDRNKKIQSEMKDSLIEIKNNLQGNKNRVHEAKNQINDWSIRKQKTTNQNNKKKRESRKMRIM